MTLPLNLQESVYIYHIIIKVQVARAFLNRRSSRIYDRSLLRKKWFPAGGIGVGGLHPRSRKDRKDQDRHTKKTKKYLLFRLSSHSLPKPFASSRNIEPIFRGKTNSLKCCIGEWWFARGRPRCYIVVMWCYVDALCTDGIYLNMMLVILTHSKLFVNLNARPALTQWSTLCETSLLQPFQRFATACNLTCLLVKDSQGVDHVKWDVHRIS
jgi:hypothetical protein